MFEYLEDLELENEEKLSKSRAKRIKSSVLSRIEGRKPMKKHLKIKPLLIAAAAVAVGAASIVTASAAADGEVLKMMGIFKTNNEEKLVTPYGDIYIKLSAYNNGEGKGNGASWEYRYSEDFPGVCRSYGGCPEGEDYNVSIWWMHDGGLIGIKTVPQTGEITLLPYEEAKKWSEEFTEPPYFEMGDSFD